MDKKQNSKIIIDDTVYEKAEKFFGVNKMEIDKFAEESLNKENVVRIFTEQARDLIETLKEMTPEEKEVYRSELDQIKDKVNKFLKQLSAQDNNASDTNDKI